MKCTRPPKKARIMNGTASEILTQTNIGNSGNSMEFNRPNIVMTKSANIYFLKNDKLDFPVNLFQILNQMFDLILSTNL